MVKCAFCVGYIKGRCMNRDSPLYGQVIEDPYKERDCPYYLDIASAGILGAGLI